MYFPSPTELISIINKRVYHTFRLYKDGYHFKLNGIASLVPVRNVSEIVIEYTKFTKLIKHISEQHSLSLTTTSQINVVYAYKIITDSNSVSIETETHVYSESNIYMDRQVDILCKEKTHAEAFKAANLILESRLHSGILIDDTEV